MKILLVLLIYILNLISGPVYCFDVIGYPGGSVIISCENQQDEGSNKYFCKEKTEQCTRVETLNSWIHEDRVSLFAAPTFLRVFYRDLSLEDAGLYQCGESAVNLRVKTDPCCLGPKTVIGYLRDTITINCSYPEEFQDYIKYFYKLEGQLLNFVVDTTNPQINRFSISEDRRSRVISVRISDVREKDGGVYHCGVGIGINSISYETFFPKIHLQVSDKPYRTSSTPRVTISTEEPTNAGFFTIGIISVSICVVLLLIGGLTLIFYKLRCSRTGDFPITRRRSRTNDVVYENDLPGNQNNIRMGPIYQNLEPNTNQSESVYQSLDLRSRDSNSIYHTLNPNTNQIQSVRE